MTILFADVTSSTSLGERLDPELLQEVLRTDEARAAIMASAADLERAGALIETERRSWRRRPTSNAPEP